MEIPDHEPFGRGHPEAVRTFALEHTEAIRAMVPLDELAEHDLRLQIDTAAIVAHFRDHGFTDLQIGVMIGLNEARAHALAADADPEVTRRMADRGFLTLGLFLTVGADL